LLLSPQMLGRFSLGIRLPSDLEHLKVLIALGSSYANLPLSHRIASQEQ
jgi:hypothetical protein